MSTVLAKFARAAIRRASAAVVCAVVLWCGSRAEASCGDYVMVGGRHDAHTSVTHVFESDIPAVPRCQGPMCSDNSIPPAAPAPRMTVALERWAMTDAAGLAVLPAYDALLAEPQELTCEFRLSILRPPR